MTDSAIQTPASANEGVRRAVVQAFVQTAAAQSRDLQPLSDDLVLVDSGLDSLCFAIIVAELEDSLGLDPFSDLEEAYFPVNFGEFVQLYETAAQAAAG